MAQETDMTDKGSAPLQGVVLCCTSLAQEIRTTLPEAASAMGAVHKLDLTSDVTHLIVGSIATPKYRYVAKERPDVRVLAPSFIEAVRVEWMKGGAVDVEKLLQEHTLPPFSGLMICLTGWPDAETRRSFEEKITENGATYNGDLVKQVTHLIAAKPEGAKYTHAKQWGIKVVGLRWFEDSLKRGMALDESLYQAEMPEEMQGKGAYRTEPKRPLAKRAREAELVAAGEEAGRRKLRKVASQRLDRHSQDLWKSVSEYEVQVETTEIDVWNEDTQTKQHGATADEQQSKTESLQASRNGTFNAGEHLLSGIYVLLHGFERPKRERLIQFLEPNGAVVVDCYDALSRASENHPFQSRILLVPHADLEKLPDIPPATTVATEWWVERCVHHKRHIDPEEDPLSQPLSHVTVSGFADMTITTTGFDHVDLRQTAQAVKLMGATYQEQLLPSTSVLVCGDKTVRKEKAFYALKHNIPVVSAKWLWDSLQSRMKALVAEYRISLPAFDPSEYTGTPSMRGPTPSESRRSVDDPKRADAPQLKRLSNSRKRHNTPSLVMQPPKVADTREARETRKGPFILEDDDQDEDEASIVMDEQPLQLPTRDAPSTVTVQPLREISPNKSQPKRDASTKPDTQGHDISGMPTMDLPTRSESPIEAIPTETVEEANSVDPSHTIAADVAELLNKCRSNLNPAEPLRRKKRTLGRNLSSSNHTPRSDSIPPNLSDTARHDEEHHSAADGFSAIPIPVIAPPSTQLGYETPEAVAHREQMSRKMGMEGLMRDDEGKGVRVGSLGPVKDSERLGGGERKAKTRGRK